MRSYFPLALLFSACLICCASVADSQENAEPRSATPRWQPPASCEVRIVNEIWRDAMRERDVPVRIYLPLSPSFRTSSDRTALDSSQLDDTATAQAHPVILFSHGLGGTRTAAAYLGEHWAAHGYISIHMQHIGSDESVWRETREPLRRMREAASARNAVSRIDDVRFILDRLEVLSEQDSSPLFGLMDLSRIGMAGHSFGAHTTLAIAGRSMPRRFAEPFQRGDTRVIAAVALSPAPSDVRDQKAAHSTIGIPMLHMTGTEDRSAIRDTTPEQRRIPFDMIDAADQYLVIFEGGDHRVFSGRPGHRESAERYGVIHDLIRQATLAFWEAHLRGDTDAKAWLAEGGYAAALADAGRLEVKFSDER